MGLRLVPGAGSLQGPTPDRQDGAPESPSVHLVREYKGALVDTLDQVPDADTEIEQMPTELESVLAEIERGDLAAAERVMDGQLHSQISAAVAATAHARSGAPSTTQTAGRGTVATLAWVIAGLVVVLAALRILLS